MRRGDNQYEAQDKNRYEEFRKFYYISEGMGSGWYHNENI